MIVQRDIGEFTRSVSMPGNASTGVKALWLIPYACQLKSVYAKSRTAGTTATQTVDLLKNNTTIFSGAVLINQATGVTVNTYGPLTTNPTTFVKGDQLAVSVATINTTPAVDWTLELCFQRLRGTGAGAAMETDTAVGIKAE